MTTAKAKAVQSKNKTPKISVEKEELKRPLAFVIMPFSEAKPVRGKGKYRLRSKEELNKLWSLINQFLKDEGYHARRSDSSGNILQRIVQDIDTATIVVVVLTGLNPNVMYELGIAHGLRKKTILLTESLDELPFDIRGYNSIEYGFGTAIHHKALRKSIQEILTKIKDDDTATYGPVETHLEVGDYAVSKWENRVASRRLNSLLDELTDIMFSHLRLINAVVTAFPKAVVKESNRIFLNLNSIPINTCEIDSRKEWILSRYRVFPSLELICSDDYIPYSMLSEDERSRLGWALSVLLNHLSSSDSNFFHQVLCVNTLCQALIPDLKLILARLRGESNSHSVGLSVLTRFDSNTIVGEYSQYLLDDYTAQLAHIVSGHNEVNGILELFNLKSKSPKGRPPREFIGK